jgi:transcription elongation factor GreA-like protein
VRDQVVHDTYGLGRITGVEADTAVAVDFGSCRVRLLLPCAKLAKL